MLNSNSLSNIDNTPSNSIYETITQLISSLKDEECDKLIHDIERIKKTRQITNKALKDVATLNWDSLEELIASEDGVFINLSDTLQAENSLFHRCSLAWLLVWHKKTELIRKIALHHNNNHTFSFDFNESPPNQNVLSGCTLAWLLTHRNNTPHKELINFLTTNAVTSVDLSAQPLHPQNPYHKHTVAWNILFQNDVELFIRLLKRQPSAIIDLNEKHRGITLAWLLAVRGLVNLLDYLIDHHHSGIVDLNACPETSKFSSVTLYELLLRLKANGLLNKLKQRMLQATSDQAAVATLPSSLSTSSCPQFVPSTENQLALSYKVFILPQKFYELGIDQKFSLDDPQYYFFTDKQKENTYKIMYFIQENRRDLLEQFIINGQITSIDFNALVCTLNSPFNFCTLAVLLIEFDCIELFKILLKSCPKAPIDLNARFPYPNCTTLAWMLADKGEISMLEYLVANNSSTKIDLVAKPRNIRSEWLTFNNEESAAGQSLIDVHHPDSEKLYANKSKQPTLKELLLEARANTLLARLAPIHHIMPRIHIPQPTPQQNQAVISSQEIQLAPPETSKILTQTFFSKKYLHTTSHPLQEIHRLKKTNDAPQEPFSCQYQLITLAEALQINGAKALTCQDTIDNSDFQYLTSFSYYAPRSKNLAKQTVTFIFAGRKENAYIPNLNALGDQQQCIVVLTHDEFKLLNIQSCPDSLGFLIIHSLATESHGVYTNTGSIQARRLAAFWASYYWQVQDCLYLDDNIESVGINLPQSSTEWLWSDITYYLQRQRETNNALIAGLPTSSNRDFNSDIQLYYCSKLFSMNFQQIKALLELQTPDEVFILGYPALYADMCGEDYFFQVLIDFANSSCEDSIMNLCSNALLSQGAIKRSASQSGMAKRSVRDYTHIEQIDLKPDHLKELKEKYQSWISLTIMKLKEHAQNSRKRFEARQNYEKIRSDLPKVALYNTAIKKRIAESDPETEFQPIRKKNISPKQKEKTYKTQNTKDWTPFFSGKHLNQLMEDNPLSLDTYLTSISHICYSYQREVLNLITKTEEYHGVLRIATGAGKTRLQILLANYLVANQTNGPIHIVTATQQLVEQFYDAFQETLKLLKGNAHITLEEVISVRSGAGNVPWRNYHANNTLKRQAKVVIFCCDSYQLLQQELSHTNDTVYTEPSLILLDEFHLYTTMAKKFLQSQATVLGFSATPPKEYQPIYHFSRLDSLHAKITVPMIIDRLPYKLSKANEKRAEKISELLNNHRHPRDGQPLANTKGIIFVSSITEADQFARVINQDRSQPLALSVHSGLSNYTQLITHFQKKQFNQQSILIVVGMLQTGYDDKNLSWCIIARNNNENSATVHQIIGRVLRNNTEDPKKIAYVLADHHLNLSEFGLLKDNEAITKAHQNYFKGNREIIYLDIQYAIQKNEPFLSYQFFFEQDCLKDHSLKKHLELALHATTQEWLANLLRYNQRLTQDDILACFGYEAYGFFYNSEKTENKNLYTAKKFQELLGALIQCKPQQLKSWITDTGKKSCTSWMEKIASQYHIKDYINVLNEYKQKVTPECNDLITQEITTSKVTFASHSLFTQPNIFEGNINSSYLYQDEDVYHILKLRLQNSQTPGLIVLGVAHMSENKLGNRIFDILHHYLTGPFAPQRKNTSIEDIIIPIAYENHWVGIRIQLKIGAQPKITYYNSIKNHIPNVQLMASLLKEVNQALAELGLWPEATEIKPFERALEQHDGTSCGAFLIENIYCDLEQKNWSVVPNPAQTIRARHLKLLQQEDPKFYKQFCARQRQEDTLFQSLSLH